MDQTSENVVYLVLQPAPAQIYCRICLTTSLTSKYKVLASSINSFQTLSQIIEDFAQISIEESDGFSKLICMDCFNKLTVAVEFKSLIQDTHLKLINSLIENNDLLSTLLPQDDDIAISDFDVDKIFQDDTRLEDSELIKELQEEVLIALEKNDNNVNNNNEECNVDVNLIQEPETEVRKVKKKQKRYAVKCSECDVILRNYKSIRDHSKLHQSLNRFHCSVCNKGFWVKSEWLDHEAIHKPNLPYQCDICGKGFKDHTRLKSHKLVHDDSKYNCNQCDRVFRSVGLLNQHKLLHSDEYRYQCTMCERKFKNALQRGNHMTAMHKRKNKEICNICGKTVRSLIYHRKWHLKPYQCEICDRSFSTNQILNNHRISHTEDRSFSCEICQKSFKHSASLLTHQRVHDADRQFQCVLCEKKFNYKHLLKRHMRNAHQNDNEDVD